MSCASSCGLKTKMSSIQFSGGEPNQLLSSGLKIPCARPEDVGDTSTVWPSSKIATASSPSKLTVLATPSSTPTSWSGKMRSNVSTTADCSDVKSARDCSTQSIATS